MMKSKTVVSTFQPRDYQRPFFEAMENSNGRYRHAIFIGPRRLGKDYMAWAFAIRHALRKTTSVLYLLPTYSQAKVVIWDALSSDGVRFLDMINPELVRSMNASEMKITLTNNSIIQLRGADNYDRSIVGSNASLIIFSEAAICDPRAYEFASPIVAANGGSMIFITTPRGRNWLYTLWKQAQNWPDWFCYRLTVDDTKHISKEELDKERQKHSEEFISQEYFCSFDRGIEGSFYAKYITNMIIDGRIGRVPYDPSLPVSSSWDLGFNDQTVILLYQLTKTNLINIIDCYSNTNQPLGHYIKWLKDQPYIYAKHFGPHDIEIHDYQTGNTRIEMARSLGLNFETREVKGKLGSATPRVSVADGIERVMASFSRIYIDAVKCDKLIKALESYHREWDDDRKVYKQAPLHDWSSDWADALRYLCLTADMNTQGMTAEDARRGYEQAMYTTTTPIDNPLAKIEDGRINPFSELGRKYF
ncbi:unnamed protein product [Sphagnum balticum]